MTFKNYLYILQKFLLFLYLYYFFSAYLACLKESLILSLAYKCFYRPNAQILKCFTCKLQQGIRLPNLNNLHNSACMKS